MICLKPVNNSLTIWQIACFLTFGPMPPNIGSDMKIRARQSSFQGIVWRVIDGDTIVVLVALGWGVHAERRIRLAGVDSWELDGHDRDKAKIAAGIIGATWLHQLVTVTPVKTSSDRYGRAVCSVAGDRGDLAAWIVAQGQGWPRAVAGEPRPVQRPQAIAGNCAVQLVIWSLVAMSIAFLIILGVRDRLVAVTRATAPTVTRSAAPIVLAALGLSVLFTGCRHLKSAGTAERAAVAIDARGPAADIVAAQVATAAPISSTNSAASSLRIRDNRATAYPPTAGQRAGAIIGTAGGLGAVGLVALLIAAPGVVIVWIGRRYVAARTALRQTADAIDAADIVARDDRLRAELRAHQDDATKRTIAEVRHVS